MWLSTHHIIFTQAIVSAAFSEGICASLCHGSPEEPLCPDRMQEMVSLARVSTRGPGHTLESGLTGAPWWRNLSDLRARPPDTTLRVTVLSKRIQWQGRGQLQPLVYKSQGPGLEERRCSVNRCLNKAGLNSRPGLVWHWQSATLKDSLGACHLTVPPPLTTHSKFQNQPENYNWIMEIYPPPQML